MSFQQGSKYDRVLDPGWQGKREEERDTDLFSVTHFPFLFTTQAFSRDNAKSCKSYNRSDMRVYFIFLHNSCQERDQTIHFEESCRRYVNHAR